MKAEQLVKDFNEKKSKRLNEMRLRVENATLEQQNAVDRQNVLNNELQTLQTELNGLNSVVIDKSKADSLEAEIAKLTAEISTLKMNEVKEEVSNKITEIKAEMARLNLEIGKQAIVADIQNSVEMLKKSSLALTAQEQLRLKKQMQLTEYVQQKVKLVNQSVNSHFEGIEFNFFKYNTALAENPWESTCTVTMDGKNYSCLSNGEKAICDVRTMKGLQSILGVNIPVWLDNYESVSYDIEVEQQFIGLRVVKDVKLSGVLRVDKFYTLADCVIKGGN